MLPPGTSGGEGSGGRSRGPKVVGLFQWLSHIMNSLQRLQKPLHINRIKAPTRHYARPFTFNQGVGGPKITWISEAVASISPPGIHHRHSIAIHIGRTGSTPAHTRLLSQIRSLSGTSSNLPGESRNSWATGWYEGVLSGRSAAPTLLAYGPSGWRTGLPRAERVRWYLVQTPLWAAASHSRDFR